jgi:hypothetical protein
LLYEEDPEGIILVSILAQEGVDAVFSGALITDKEGNPVIEGVRGQGDQFMLGRARDPLPTEVEASVRQLHTQIFARFGPVRFEWVYDGTQVWIVQFHRGATGSYGRTIYPGRPHTYHRFTVENGIEALCSLIARVEGRGDGIILVGDVIVTGHLGDLLRRAKIPSHIASRSAQNGLALVRGQRSVKNREINFNHHKKSASDV